MKTIHECLYNMAPPKARLHNSSKLICNDHATLTPSPNNTKSAMFMMTMINQIQNAKTAVNQ